MTLRWLKGRGNDAIANDDTYFPILITTWFNSPTEALIRDHFQWLNEQLARAKRERQPMIVVNDTGLAGVPSAEARRLIAELTNQLNDAGAKAIRIGSYTIIESSVMRGVMNTLSWLHGDLQSENVSTAEQALTLALRTLSKHSGAQIPAALSPQRYHRPEKPSIEIQKKSL